MTVPSSHLYIVKNVACVNTNTSTAGVLSVYCNGSGGADRLLRVDVPADRSIALAPWWVFDAGDTIQAQRGTSSLILSLFGYDLEV